MEGIHSRPPGKVSGLGDSKHHLLLLSLRPEGTCDSKATGQNENHSHASGVCCCRTRSFVIPTVEVSKVKKCLQRLDYCQSYRQLLLQAINHTQPRPYEIHQTQLVTVFVIAA